MVGRQNEREEENEKIIIERTMKTVFIRGTETELYFAFWSLTNNLITSLLTNQLTSYIRKA